MNREKVIKGFETQLYYLAIYADPNELFTLTQDQAKDILTLLKEQEKQIEQLEHDLAVTENNINYYVNGND